MIYRLAQIYSANVTTRLWSGRWVLAVCVRADTFLDRVRGAAAVLTGRAVAFRYPKDGELEAAIFPDRRTVDDPGPFIHIGDAAADVLDELAQRRMVRSLGFGGIDG